jgi:dephospho-CoA kinase
MTGTLRIGLTGGIASGKSVVAAAFARRGVPVVDADQLAREVVEPGTPALAAVVQEFGSDILGPDRHLDRPRLRAMIFADAARRRRLEAILHPAIRAAMEARIVAISAPYAIVAIPLLAESGLRNSVDRVLLVDCPPELQIERLAARDGETPAGARAILAAQATRGERLAVADDVLENTGTLADLERAVGALHERYLSLVGDSPNPSADRT